MAEVLPVGPYRTIVSVEGDEVPYYVIPFDKDGCCVGPRTLEHLLDAAAGFSDIFVFSHGWNNDWSAATQRYESFVNGWQALRREFKLPMPAGYKPLLVGIFWPSQALAWFDSELAPAIAASDPAAQDRYADASSAVLRDVAEALPAAARAQFYALAQSDRLATADAQALATLLAAAAHPDDEGVRDQPPTAQDLLTAAATLEQPEPDYDEVGTATPGAAGVPLPRAAFSLGDVAAALDPRNIIKPFTVWHMKDRAGRVGHDGVAPMLEALLSRSSARIHLIGHSYGCKILMTALCAPASLARKVESALLLQPAVSQYAFAAQVPERDVPGGFARALGRVNQPIVATYSENDWPLTRLFHLSVRRSDDLGELQYAGDGTSPSRYGALGGFGPQACRARFVQIQDAGGDYDFSDPSRVIGVDGTRTISGHGDISSPSTWWLSYRLASAHGRPA